MRYHDAVKRLIIADSHIGQGANDAELRAIIGSVWGLRGDRYSEERAEETEFSDRATGSGRIEMHRIGG